MLAKDLAHSGFASGHVQLDQALETGKSRLRQASGHVQVGLLGGGELFSVEVHVIP